MVKVKKMKRWGRGVGLLKNLFNDFSRLDKFGQSGRRWMVFLGF
jgi:hypothetical protein